MSDLVITAANVVKGSGSRTQVGTAGASITPGQVVYLDSATNTYKLADCDSATASVRSPAGIALNTASSNQPLSILTSGSITIGATVTAGVAYYLSATPGGICPVADLGTGDYPVILGIATSASVINIDVQEAGVALA